MSSERRVPRPVALVVLDGWGVSDACPNACSEAKTPNFNRLNKEYPATCLEASGEAVGLMPGQMGDSNVGHLNIGAGRIVYQDVVRISKAIREGSFFKNRALLGAVREAKTKGAAVHLMGLLSDGGVHSLDTHVYALLELCRKEGQEKVFVHAFLDGRDVPPQSAATYLERLEDKMRELGVGRLSTIQGRFYAMDRDKRWERVQKGYLALTSGEGAAFPGWKEALRASYERGETDEFVTPTVLGSRDGLVRDGDSLILWNFRADRAREITRAFVEPDFSEFDRKSAPKVRYCGMVRYEEGLGGEYAYLPITMENTLGEVVSKAGLRQLRIAETEKYAHVTFFLNGKKDDPFPGEDRVLIPSPKDVATYDQKPEMSAFLVTEEAIARVRSGAYDLIVLNYANPDMVGHTGSYDAAVRALEVVDKCLGDFLDAVLAAGGAALVVADHGNVEDVTPGATAAHTYHSMNRVPCILVGHDFKQEKLRAHGVLADIAPTLLMILGLPKPAEMDRHSLIERELEG
ncbi:MAG: 2,3-bisphosphoglycerate-independent phosphoglycerate mutase [Bacillota bacterium]